MGHCKVCGDLLETADERNKGICATCEKHSKKFSDVENRRTCYVDMHELSPAFYKNGSFVEVTEWTNGEGVDIFEDIDRKEKRFSFHIDELEAIINCISKLGYMPFIYFKDEDKEKKYEELHKEYNEDFVRDLATRYLNEYYDSYPQLCWEYPNWGELDEYTKQHPKLMQALMDGENWAADIADDVYDEYYGERKLSKNTKF